MMDDVTVETVTLDSSKNLGMVNDATVESVTPLSSKNFGMVTTPPWKP